MSQQKRRKPHIIRAKTTEQYIEMVRQAVFEVEELRAIMEYDEESMGGAKEFLSDLETSLNALWESMKDGSYVFATGDLPFMKIVKHADDRLLPFKYLLVQINETHMKGLDIDRD
jgi:hypothetical protein